MLPAVPGPQSITCAPHTPPQFTERKKLAWDEIAEPTTVEAPTPEEDEDVLTTTPAAASAAGVASLNPTFPLIVRNVMSDTVTVAGFPVWVAGVV